MAIEKNGQMTYVDAAGNEYLLFPKTKAECVEGLTPEAVGAAPAGYGLGDVAPTMWSGSVTDITKSGWYWYQDSTASGGPYHEGVILASIGPYHSRLDFFVLHANEYSGCHAVRVKNWNGWQEWEWENPPMIPGVEYRTTERWNGKAVYTVLVNCGACTSLSYVDTDFVGKPIRGESLVASSDGTYHEVLPTIVNGSLTDGWSCYCNVSMNNGKIRVTTVSGTNQVADGRSIRCTVYYVKD